MWYVLYMCASDKQQKAMEQHLAQLEESCRQKEAERVDLELRLTEVKEILKKSLTGGILGAPVESKPTIKVPSLLLHMLFPQMNLILQWNSFIS